MIEPKKSKVNKNLLLENKVSKQDFVPYTKIKLAKINKLPNEKQDTNLQGDNIITGKNISERQSKPRPKASRIKNAEQKSFMMQFPTSEFTDSVSHFLYKNGHKAIKADSNTLEIFVVDVPEESPILKNLVEQDFSPEQLAKIWDLLNTNGLVLVDVNNQFSTLDLFNGKGLPQINKEEFIKIIKNQ